MPSQEVPAAASLEPAPSSGSSAPADLFVRAALARPPGEIAEVVVGLHAGGQAEFAARIVTAAVTTWPVPEVTALALALLAADPSGAAAAGAVPPQRPPAAR
ncbi:hypothetical protein [Streptomyces sp. NPDC001194]|uniref:hypothetical protein n=1 Tax=Streptomyces sp. NPDC001194 TaxID=3364547 RepID=UPI0036C7B419